MSVKVLIASLFIGLSASFLGGCTGTSIELDSTEHKASVKETYASLQQKIDGQSAVELSIEAALEIAVAENLDARISALEYLAAQGNVTLEKIKALPSMEYSATRSGRSRESASTSLSAATGLQSLESSISAERYHNTRDATFNWNLIDTANTLMQAKTLSDRTKIAKERHQKVLQNIHRDVYSAYWRASSGEKFNAQTSALIARANKHINQITEASNNKLISKGVASRKKAPYYETITSLENLSNSSQLAEIELKSLLNLPQSTTIILTSKPADIQHGAENLLDADMELLEIAALRRRPEMREAFLNTNISIRNTKQEIIKTLPGAELFYGFNADNNKFLANKNWHSYSASVVQSITNLLSFPDRYQIARKAETLEDARRITLSAAIIAQINIARHSLANSKKLYDLDKAAHDSFRHQTLEVQKKSDAGYLAKSEALLMDMQAHEKAILSLQSEIAMQESYATLVNTLGLEVGDKVSIKSFKTGEAS